MISDSMKRYKERTKRIMRATNNGKCWWLYQMLTHQPPRERKNNGKI